MEKEKRRIIISAPRQIFFTDFTNNFAKSPFSDDLAIVKNEKSINQSLRNILLTNFGERPFQPTVGSAILSSMFDESGNPATILLLETYIENAIRVNEPRVNLLAIEVAQGSDKNTINIMIEYTFIAIPTIPQTLNVLLQRNR